MGITSTNPKDRVGMKKPPLELIPPVALIHESMAFKDGAKKYGPYNWRDEKVSARIYVAAAMRHLQEWLDGEELSQDAHVHHLGHARACCGILLDAQSLGQLVDDRPKPGKAAELIAQFTEKTSTPIPSSSPSLLYSTPAEEAECRTQIYANGWNILRKANSAMFSLSGGGVLSPDFCYYKDALGWAKAHALSVARSHENENER